MHRLPPGVLKQRKGCNPGAVQLDWLREIWDRKADERTGESKRQPPVSLMATPCSAGSPEAGTPHVVRLSSALRADVALRRLPCRVEACQRIMQVQRARVTDCVVVRHRGLDVGSPSGAEGA